LPRSAQCTRQNLAETAVVIDEILNCDVIEGLRRLPEGQINTVITSPPYSCGMDYGKDAKGQPISDELSWDEY